MIEAKTLCQSCIERGLPPNEAIGLWQSMPICDTCLQPLIENLNQVPPAPNQVEIEVKNAIEFVEELEKLFDKFPIASEQVLRSHDDFYNHRALANINIPAGILEKIIDNRKSIIFALNRRNEPDVIRLQEIKREERAKAGIVGIEKSKKEHIKLGSSTAKRTQIQKHAKQLSITYEEAENQAKDARQKEFAGILRNEKQNVQPKAVGERDTREILEAVRERVSEPRTSNNNSRVSGSRCPNCKKFTCIC